MEKELEEIFERKVDFVDRSAVERSSNSIRIAANLGPARGIDGSGR